MILPPPRSIIDGTHACAQISAPLTFTAITRSHQSRRSRASGLYGIWLISAALLTRMSIPPNVSRTRVRQRLHGGRLDDVDVDADRTHARRR